MRDTKANYNVSAVFTVNELSEPAIVVNYNDDPASTDYDESDRLYFEELGLECVLDISVRENPEGVIASLGDHIHNNLVMPLSKTGVNILGTDQESSKTQPIIGAFWTPWAWTSLAGLRSLT